MHPLLSAFLPASLVLLNPFHFHSSSESLSLHVHLPNPDPNPNLFPSNQAPFHVHAAQHPLAAAIVGAVPPGDPAGHPNNSTRFELTANRTTLFCGQPSNADAHPDVSSSGYVHFTNNLGKEDKHMFWWLYEARHDPQNAPIVLTFGGGPGGSGQLFPFSGAGPCQVQLKQNGDVEAVPSPYSWTEHVNLLAIDHPVGVGFSYGNLSSLRNSSESAAWDVDDFLQAFWREYPHLVKNQFMINSGSYGGTFIPHVVNTIHQRNQAALAALASNEVSHKRILKAPSEVMMANVWSDIQTHIRWFHESNCHNPNSPSPPPDANKFFNSSTCTSIIHSTPPCLDSIQLAYEHPSLKNRYQALESCMGEVIDFGRSKRNPYDVREDCSGGCVIDLSYLDKFMDSDIIRNATGVPKSIPFKALELPTVGIPFILNGDHVQPAYRLLAPSIEAGLRVLNYNGMMDGACPWRSSLAWMKLLKTQHQTAFLNAEELPYPGVGTIRKVGHEHEHQAGAGDYVFVKVREAGHMVIQSQPELLQHMMKRWLDNEAFF